MTGSGGSGQTELITLGKKFAPKTRPTIKDTASVKYINSAIEALEPYNEDALMSSLRVEDQNTVNLRSFERAFQTVHGLDPSHSMHSIDAVFAKEVNAPRTLVLLDQCILLIVHHWSNPLLLAQAEVYDARKLLQSEALRTTWNQIQQSITDSPRYIVARLLGISKMINKMALVVRNQKMIYLPNNQQEMEDLLDNCGVDDDFENEEKKFDENNKLHASAEVIELILLRNRQLFIHTPKFHGLVNDKQHKTKNSSAFVLNIVKNMSSKPVSPMPPSNTNTNTNTNTNSNSHGGTAGLLRLSSHDEEHGARPEIRLPFNEGGGGAVTPPMDSLGVVTERVPDQPSTKPVSLNDEAYQSFVGSGQTLKLRPICEGCGNTIDMASASPDSDTRLASIVTYRCNLLEDLIYFHDRNCEYLRKYKECIRQYASDDANIVAFSNQVVPTHEDTIRYGIALLNNYQILININDSVLPRPAPIFDDRLDETARQAAVLSQLFKTQSTPPVSERGDSETEAKTEADSNGQGQGKGKGGGPRVSMASAASEILASNRARAYHESAANKSSWTLPEVASYREIAVRIMNRAQFYLKFVPTKKKKKKTGVTVNDLKRVSSLSDVPRGGHSSNQSTALAVKQIGIMSDKIQTEDAEGIGGGGFDKFGDVPLSIQYMIPHVFGESLFQFILGLLLIKQADILWTLLAYVSMQMPTPTALELLELHRTDLAKVKKMSNLDSVCAAIIETSSYPIATALHLSGFMTLCSENDLSRANEFAEASTRYINIAETLVQYIESDHLLAILLETPTDLGQMNVFDIAIKFELGDFVDSNRVDTVMSQMWQEFDFLNPRLAFNYQEVTVWGILQGLLCNTAEFYYTPVGKYWIASIMYAAYVVLVTMVVMHQQYMYKPLNYTEYIMWFCNVGYITYEITEMMLSGFEYFQEMSNIFDSTIVILWLVLGAFRFLLPELLSPEHFYSDEADFEANEFFDATELQLNDQRNKVLSVAYTVLFGIQICILFLRFASILSRNRRLGPFIRMVIQMLSDIVNFVFLLSIFFAGFSLAMYFVLGPDTRTECLPDGRDFVPPLTDIGSVCLYVFQILVGEEDWMQTYSNECLPPMRAAAAQFFLVTFSVLGTILLLNLLIAMMASTYDDKTEFTSKDVNFSRTADTYALANRNALISPPFNVVVYAFTIVFTLFSLLVVLFSCGRYFLNITKLSPINIDYRTAEDEHSFDDGRCCCKCGCQGPGHKCRNWCTIFSPTRNGHEFTLSIYMNPFNANGRRFCRFCRFEMKKNGDISDYFDLFDNYKLDEDDVKFIKRTLYGRGVCSNCFRPYKRFADGSSNRATQWEIAMEIISYYVFRVFIHIPMIIIIFLPAMMGAFIEFTSALSDKKAAEKQEKLKKNTTWATAAHTARSMSLIGDESLLESAEEQAAVGSVNTTDEQYRRLVASVIEEEMMGNIDEVSEQVTDLSNVVLAQAKVQMDQQNKLDNIINMLESLSDKIDVLSLNVIRGTDTDRDDDDDDTEP